MDLAESKSGSGRVYKPGLLADVAGKSDRVKVTIVDRGAFVRKFKPLMDQITDSASNPNPESIKWAKSQIRNLEKQIARLDEDQKPARKALQDQIRALEKSIAEKDRKLALWRRCVQSTTLTVSLQEWVELLSPHGQWDDEQDGYWYEDGGLSE